ncbi:(2R 3R)-2 [Mactra antiquata]
MVDKVQYLAERYEIFRIVFTASLCLIPYVFLRLTISFLLISLVSWIIRNIWWHVNDIRISSNGRGVFITGCDSGFGFLFAQHFDELGYTVFAGCLSEKSDGARKLRKEGTKRLHVVEIDVTKEKSIAEALVYVRKHLPRKGLWGIINNAGINMYGEVEIVPVSLYEKCFDVNLYGPIRVLKEFTYLIRKTKGRIVNITSVHGLMCTPGQSTYETTKHGMETLSDSLRLEMSKFDVKVIVVEPGMFGRVTSICNEAMIKKRTEDILEMWDQATPEVKKSYSKSYLMSWLPKPVAKWPPEFDDISSLIRSVEHAISSETPNSRYMVDGKGITSFLDHYAIIARVYNLLPTWIMDAVIAKWRNCYKKPK